MKVLVIGSGGREHALAWRIAQSPSVNKVYACPGNPGIAEVATCIPAATDPAGWARVAKDAGVDLTVVGPEAPLVAGVVDAFKSEAMPIVGPSRQAAQLEGSKIFAKNFFLQSRIPTAGFAAVDTHDDARKALDRFGAPVVVKADGLAAGKGVVVAQTRAEAEAAIAALGPKLVIEEFLQGEEISFICLCDGKRAIPMAATQDHKAVYNGDRGPNTGGMGAYSDDRLLSEADVRMVMDTVIQPTVDAMKFTGFLYAGLMMTANGPKVLEFNVRMGDPETQPLMHRLRSDFGEVLMAAARGRLDGVELKWAPGASVCVVLASEGYPGDYPTGRAITGIAGAGVTVFHAGTRMGAHGLETAGGRVLGVTASANTLQMAIDEAYAGVRKIHFDGMHYRTDIGRKGLARYNKSSVGT